MFGYEANQFYDKFIIGSEQSESNSSERSKKRDKKRKVREIELEWNKELNIKLKEGLIFLWIYICKYVFEVN